MDSIKNFFVFKIKGFNPKRCVVAIFKMEGSHQEVSYQKKNLNVLAKDFNPVFAGSSQGRSGYNLTLSNCIHTRFFYGSKHHRRNLRKRSSVV